MALGRLPRSWVDQHTPRPSVAHVMLLTEEKSTTSMGFRLCALFGLSSYRVHPLREPFVVFSYRCCFWSLLGVYRGSAPSCCLELRLAAVEVFFLASAFVFFSHFPWHKPVWLIVSCNKNSFSFNILTCNLFARS